MVDISGLSVSASPGGRVAGSEYRKSAAAGCPVQSNDSRIVVVSVPPLDPLDMIPRTVLYELLNKEAAAFLGTLFKIEIPPCLDRLKIPVIDTEAKERSVKLNQSSLEVFIEEYCHDAPGQSVRYGDFWVRFQEWLDPNEVNLWSKIRCGRSLPDEYPKGRLTADGGQFHVANLSFIQPETTGTKRLILHRDTLVAEG